MAVSASPIHPASLVASSVHNPALLELVNAKVSRNVIAYVAECVGDAVDYAFSRPGPSAPARGRAARRDDSSFAKFVTRVVNSADVQMPVLLVTLTYIHRARRHLQIALEEWACERVFLGALIVASKYLNDSTLKNVHWAYCTGVFGKSDVGRIEREFLDVLAFELGVSEEDLQHYQPGLAKAARLHERRHRRSGDAPAPLDTAAARRHPSAASSGSSPSSAVPELASPSSSASSSNSVSPQTPATLVSPTFGQKVAGEPVHAPAPAPAPMDVDTPAHAHAHAHAVVAAKAAKPKRHSPLDLLRSIPLPRGAHHHQRAAAPAPAPPLPPRSSATWV